MPGDADRPDQTERSESRHVKVAPLQPRAVSHQDDDAVEPLALRWLCLLAFVVGIVTGFGAVVFRALIGLVHNAFFLGRLSFAYDASHFTAASPWGAFVILVPVLGGLVVTWIVSTFAPEAKGHGVPEVMDAIYYKRGVIRPVVAVVKSIASAFAIGSGAAVGREGPIIQIARHSARRSDRSYGCPQGNASRWWRQGQEPVSPRLSTRRSAACCSPPN